MEEDLFRGGVNCCFRHSVHQMMRRIPSLSNCEMFWDYMREDKVNREQRKDQVQEDAGYYLMNLIDERRWLSKIWKSECGVRFHDREPTKREPIIVVHADTSKGLSTCVTESLITKTPEILIERKIRHPPPRYLVLNVTDKVNTVTPMKYFDRVDFSGVVSYRALGYVVHIGAGNGHYVYLTSSGEIYNDLIMEIKTIPPATLCFDRNASPTLVLYKRTTRRKNLRRKRMNTPKLIVGEPSDCNS